MHEYRCSVRGLQIGSSVHVELFKGDSPGLISQVERSSGVRRLSAGRVGESGREQERERERESGAWTKKRRRGQDCRESWCAVARGTRNSPFTYLFHEGDPPGIDGKCRDALSGPSRVKNPRSPPSVIEISTAESHSSNVHPLNNSGNCRQIENYASDLPKSQHGWLAPNGIR